MQQTFLPEPWEHQFLALLCQGMGVPDIAPIVGKSYNKDRAQFAAIYRKLGAKTREQAVALYAYRLGLRGDQFPGTEVAEVESFRLGRLGTCQ